MEEKVTAGSDADEINKHFSIKYYFLMKCNIRALGLWPYDNKFISRVMQLIVFVITVMGVIPQYIRLFEELGINFISFEIICLGTFCFGSLCKFIFYTTFQKQINYILKEIALDWKVLKQEEDQKLLEEYANIGRLGVLCYTSMVHAVTFVFNVEPFIPIALDYIAPLNESRSRRFHFYSEWGVDPYDYYWELAILAVITCTVCSQIHVTFDTCYTQCVQHTCVLFEILKHRIEKVTNTDNVYKNQKDKDETIYEGMVDAVKIHRKAMEFVDIMEECFSLMLFLSIPLNALMLTVAAVLSTLSFRAKLYYLAIRTVGLYFGYLFHFLLQMLLGQAVLDASDSLLYAAAHCDWYHTSQRTKTLLKIILLRSMKPCQFTAKGLVPSNLATFATVFKSSCSYTALLNSLQ